MKQSAPRFFSWLLAILLPIFAIYPALFNAIEEHAYDAAEFHIFRGVVFSAARADGWLYPRWVQAINGGLGGPLFEFYSPLPYFLMDVLNRFGITHPIGWRVLTAMALLAASTGMFGLALALFRRADVALVSAAIFCYNPYLLRDLFERGSPQGFAVALLPFLLWLLYHASERPSGIRIVLAGVSFAAIILIHNATALLLTPVVVIFLFFVILRDKRRALAPIAGLIAGLLLAAFYLIPYVAEIQFVQFENPLFAGYALPAANPLQWQDFLSLPRVFDIGLGNNAMAENGGLFHAVALVLAIPVVHGLVRQRRAPDLFLVISNWLLVIFVMWMQTDSATFIWNAIPALNVFQFRWRLLSVMGLVSAIILGYFFAQLQTRFKSILVVTVIAVYVLLQLPSIYPDLLFRYVQFSPRPTVADAQAFALKSDAAGLTSFNEYLPRWRQLPITNYVTSVISNLPSGARVLSDTRRNALVQTKIETPQAFTVAMNVLYYPGWVGYVDGQAAAIRPSERSGLIAMNVPSGTHTVELHYEGTFAQRLGDSVSIASAIAMILISVILRERSRRRILLTEFESESSNKMLPHSLRSGSTSSAQHDNVTYLPPRWWIPTVIVLLAALKAFWVDPQTTLFRATLTCDAIQDSVVQTNIWFGNRIRLCGYALSGAEFQPNDVLHLTLYWELDAFETEPAFSFVHLLGDKFNPDTNTPLWGQQDKQTPAEHAITDWAPRKLYRDVYAFRVAPRAPSGNYQLEIGWQDVNGKRLKPKIVSRDSALAVSDLDSLLLPGIQIR